MPTYQYTARDSAGEQAAGLVEARSSIDAYNQLRRQGLQIERIEIEDDTNEPAADAAVPSAVEPTLPTGMLGVTAQSMLFAEPISSDVPLDAEDLAEFAARVAGITKAQLPLAPGLRALSEELPTRRLRHALLTLCARVEQGEPLEEVLQTERMAIPRHIAGLIVVGVRSGRLGEIMEWFLKHVRHQIDLRRHCRACVFYPAVLLTAAFGASLFGLVLIVPEFKRIYGEFNIDLPGLTLAFIAASQFVRSVGIFVLGGILLLACGAVLLVNLAPRPFKHRLLAMIPFVGTMFRCSALSGFCELLAMFVSGRLPLADAVRFAGEGSGDADLDVQLQAVALCLEQGGDDAELSRRLAAVSPHLLHVFHWKEREAVFIDSLNAAARVYEKQAQTQIALGGFFLEPIVIVGVLGGAGLFVVSLFFPLIKMLNSLA